MSNISNFTTGEYSIHVYISETRAIINPDDEESAVNALLSLSVFGQDKLTKVKKNVGMGATYWGEHFFFNKKIEETYEIEGEKLTIKVLNNNKLGRDALVGTFDISLATVYLSENHCLKHQWIGLSNVQKNYEKITGYVKISQIALEDEDILSALDPNKSAQILLPPQTQKKGYQIILTLLRGEQLRKMDQIIGSVDPFITIEYGGLIISSSTMSNNLNPVWEEQLLLPVSLPTVNNSLICKLYDKDDLKSNELMGCFSFNIQNIIDGKHKLPFWVNIYGTLGTKNLETVRIMKTYPELGSEWMGRVQLFITATENPNPVIKKLKMSSNDPVKDLARAFRYQSFEIRADIHFGLFLPDNSGSSYYIKLKWGECNAKTSKKESKGKMCEWFEQLKSGVLQFPMSASQSNLDELPDVILYLCDGNNISFYRKPVSFFFQNSTPGILYFKPDRSITDIRDDQAGIIKIRVTVATTDWFQNPQNGWNNTLVKPRFSSATLCCNIFQGQGLISSDDNGLADPYVNCYYYGKEAQTSKKYNTTNPIWNERLILPALIDENNVNESPPVVITLWDDDTAGKEFMGTSTVQINYFSNDMYEVSQPQWYEVKINSKNVVGKLLMSFDLYQTLSIPPQISIEPPTEKYHIRLKILGLRGLQSLGIISVKRPFIKFDVGSIMIGNTKTDLLERKYISTRPTDTGSNPNIATILNLTLDLPVNLDFCPNLQCNVYDYILKGLSQPQLGTFSIDLAKYILKNRQEFTEKLEIFEKSFLTGVLGIKTEKVDQQIPIKIPANRILEQTRQRKSKKSKNYVALQEEQNEEMVSMKKEFSEVSIQLTNQSQPGDNTSRNQLNKQILEKSVQEDDFNIIKIPLYDSEQLKKDKLVELTQLDSKQYLAIGYDSLTHHTKHYRKYISTELETSEYMDKSPFDEISIYRGKLVKGDQLVNQLLSNKTDIYRKVGKFKGKITIVSESQKQKIEKMKIPDLLMPGLQLLQNDNNTFHEFSSSFRLEKDILQKTLCIVRLYILDCKELPTRDEDSQSDPFLIIKCGNQVINDQSHYQMDTTNPTFYKHFDIKAYLPGDSQLEIEVWDYDKLVSNDLIGTTVIDLENRYFSPKWRKYPKKIIEARPLYHPSSTLKQGFIRLWIDIIPEDETDKINDILDIQPKPKQDYELRCIVWDSKDVPKLDVEDAVDIFISGTLPDGQKQKTDIHYRSQTGAGSFNWRFVYPIQLPLQSSRITFQIWDKDITSKDDYVGEATLDFTQEAQFAFSNDVSMKILNKEKLDIGSSDKFWIDCVRPNSEYGGSILVQMELLTKTESEQSKAGQGRGDPNQNPFLPPPLGRFEFTMNPLKLYQQLIGPAMRDKIQKYFIYAVLCLVLVYIFPSLIGSLLAKAI